MGTLVSVICILASFVLAETAKEQRHAINKKYLAHLKEEKNARSGNNQNGVK